MRLIRCYLVRNRWYNSSTRIKPVGIVVHSTGANNPDIRRYVNPAKGQNECLEQILPKAKVWGYWDALRVIGTNQYANHWNSAGMDLGVHAFIGKLADGSVAVCETLPYDRFLWGCGYGRNGSYNSDHIQFEVCEDTSDPEYTKEAYRAAVEYCAYLCKKFGWSEKQITSHVEAARDGYASNHADPEHWWKPMGFSMDQLREDVRAELGTPSEPTEAERLVEEAVKLIGLNSPDYWISVLEGQRTPSPGNIRALMGKYHKALHEKE